ncbi:hypothetical protein PanWU01x14_061630 [Parasponia andersonii]|uniref:Uncharacterized protein n=1 Tax=Parasponia andersonii TaxID=3476 RepID=A0A2P5DIC2_PARAD|nr:hypothetical protein PanWU01x14_061630 [Parasponia andersonii]
MVKREILEVVSSGIRLDNDEDAMKLALLYFVTYALMSNAKNATVPDMCFRLVDVEKKDGQADEVEGEEVLVEVKKNIEEKNDNGEDDEDDVEEKDREVDRE